MKNVWEKLPKPFLCLAPMEGVADTVYRQVLLKSGRPDLMFTEFTSVDGLTSRGFEYVAQRLKFTPEEKPLIAQIWGMDPEKFYLSAKIIKEMGFDGIDINMGCPAKDVVKTGGGAALIDKPDLARKIIKATREGAGELPVSVKTRLGRKIKVIDTWIPWLLESGIAALTIHGRTEKEMSKVPAHWEEMGKVVRMRDEFVGANNHSPVRIIGNGDIESRGEAWEKAAKYGVDGVMIGRGALKDPWIFNSSNELRVMRYDKLQLLKFHMNLFEQTWGKDKPFVTLRKYFKIYAQGFSGAVDMRERLMATRNREEVLGIIEGN
jgi:nifR3 family TIM-barrel protein